MNQKDSQTIRRLIRDDKVQAMREGRRQRATVFADRRKQASKKACGESTMVNEYLIQNIIKFLEENEEYGDDWKAEIEELEGLLHERV